MSVLEQVRLIFGHARTQVGYVDIDATIKESHDNSCIVTENPVEASQDPTKLVSQITDHVQVKPFTLTLEGIITDTPIYFPIYGNIQNFINTVAAFAGTSTRSRQQYDNLLTLQRSRVPFTVVTSLTKYNNMILQSFTVERDKDRSNCIYFTMNLIQIRLVESQTTNQAPTKPGIKDSATKMKDTGQKTPEQPTAAQAETTNRMILLSGALRDFQRRASTMGSL